jgi:hypothetical protein
MLHLLKGCNQIAGVHIRVIIRLQHEAWARMACDPLHQRKRFVHDGAVVGALRARHEDEVAVLCRLLQGGLIRLLL